MNKQNAATFLISIFCLLAICLGCAGMRKPWRSYEQKPFDAESWKNGDAIERGTMARDLLGVKNVTENVGENKSKVLATLGEPYSTREEKIRENKVTVLIYEVDMGEPEFMNAVQIFFDENDKTVIATLGVTREKESLFN
jgi:hypothetical protein